MNSVDYKRILGFKVKQLRKKLNKTQEEFCSDIGIEIPSLSNIENGKYYPSVQTIIAILCAYRVEPNEFFNFIDWTSRQNDENIYYIEEYLKPLSKELKLHIIEILKNLN